MCRVITSANKVVEEGSNNGTKIINILGNFNVVVVRCSDVLFDGNTKTAGATLGYTECTFMKSTSLRNKYCKATSGFMISE